MGDEDFKKYFDGSKKLRLKYSNTFIDFDDIETPVKEVIKTAEKVTLDAGMTTKSRFILNTNEFQDTSKMI